MNLERLLGREEDYLDPEVTPVSIIDVERMRSMRMDLYMSDPCPRCKGFCMRVGDYVCWGICYHCFCEEMERAAQPARE